MPKVKTIAMARGTLIIDENLKNLVPVLEKMNMHARTPPDKTADEKMLSSNYLTNRLFVTNNSKDFIPYASSYDIGIIATENVNSQDAEGLADIISKAIIKYNLWSIRHGFILRLNRTGKHTLKDLTV